MSSNPKIYYLAPGDILTVRTNGEQSSVSLETVTGRVDAGVAGELEALRRENANLREWRAAYWRELEQTGTDAGGVADHIDELYESISALRDFVRTER